MENTTQHFDAILAKATPTAGRVELVLTPDWSQGRAIYGGLVGALLARCAGSVAPPARRLRSILISFVGPATPDAIQLSARALRSGKAVTQVEARLEQGSETRGVALLSYAADRESVAQVQAEPAPRVTPPEDCPELPYIPGVMPPFTQHFNFRWGFGDPPFSSSKRAEFGGWCRLRDTRGSAEAEHILAMVDAWPPPLLPMLDKPAPSSSVTWSLDFVTAPDGPLDDWWAYRARTLAAMGGHGHAEACLWAPDGRLVAISRQFVAVFG